MTSKLHNDLCILIKNAARISNDINLIRLCEYYNNLNEFDEDGISYLLHNLISCDGRVYLKKYGGLALYEAEVKELKYRLRKHTMYETFIDIGELIHGFSYDIIFQTKLYKHNSSIRKMKLGYLYNFNICNILTEATLIIHMNEIYDIKKVKNDVVQYTNISSTLIDEYYIVDAMSFQTLVELLIYMLFTYKSQDNANININRYYITLLRYTRDISKKYIKENDTENKSQWLLGVINYHLKYIKQFNNCIKLFHNGECNLKEGIKHIGISFKYTNWKSINKFIKKHIPKIYRVFVDED
jgi:hypothetical protein